MMDLETLLEMAENRENFLEIADVVISNELFEEMAAAVETRPDLAFPIGKLKVYKSGFLPAGFAIGRNHRGEIIRIWNTQKERK